MFVGGNQPYRAIFVMQAKDQYLGHDRPNLAGREVDHAQYSLAYQVSRSVMHGDLGGTLAFANFRPEIDP